MDQSLFSAMNDAVAADAARLSGRRFADARGAGIARRVRTRRTVRAVGAGGASAVAVGALALGAMQLPWGGTVRPVGSWPPGCTPMPVADVAMIWVDAAEPRAHVIDVSEEFPDETWYLYDDNLAMVVLQMVPTDDGLEVTFADGTRQVVQMWSTWPTVFEAPGGGWVTFDAMDAQHHAMWHQEQPGEPSSITVMDAVAPPFAWQWAGCGLGTPTPAPTTSVGPTPLPTPSESLAAKPDDVAGDSPFECGFEFPTESYGTDDLWIDDLAWMAGAEAEAEYLKFYEDPAMANVATPAASVPAVNVHYDRADRASAIGSGLWGWTTHQDPTMEGFWEFMGDDEMDFHMAAAMGYTYVGVVDGTVVAVGTSTQDAPAGTISVAQADGSYRWYLVDPAVALVQCDASPVDLAHVDIVAVAGLAAEYEDGTVEAPIYAWLPVGTP